jgi:hypothetical protein
MTPSDTAPVAVPDAPPLTPTTIQELRSLDPRTKLDMLAAVLAGRTSPGDLVLPIKVRRASR